MAGVTHFGPESTPAFGDYDNDGDLDLYLAVWQEEAFIYRNNGDGTFTDVTQEMGLGVLGNSWSAVFSDYDSDGDLDIYASYTTRSNILYQNPGTDNNWLHIKTQGSTSNMDGIGARIELAAGGTSQIREVSGGTGYGSQDSLTVEFGLGDSPTADMVEVKWPSGVVTTLTNVQANQSILVKESFWAVETVDIEKPVTHSASSAIDSRLLPNYPNPFNPETWIPFQLAEQANVTITIHDIAGRLIRTLNLGHKSPGIYASKNEAVYWDGRNDGGDSVASGIYFCQLVAGSFSQTGKMTLKR
jgi:hypothetical protein